MRSLKLTLGQYVQIEILGTFAVNLSINLTSEPLALLALRIALIVTQDMAAILAIAFRQKLAR